MAGGGVAAIFDLLAAHPDAMRRKNKVITRRMFRKKPPNKAEYKLQNAESPPLRRAGRMQKIELKSKSFNVVAVILNSEFWILYSTVRALWLF